MATVILVIHLMIAVALVATILLQRSEGGALGMGGGGGGLVTGRGAANMLTRTTSILAAAFFVTSILLTLLARNSAGPTSILDQVGGGTPAQTQTETPAGNKGGDKPATGGVLDKLKKEGSSPKVPTSQ